MKRIIFIAALALASPSFAQTVPPPFTVSGAVPTITQWENAWSSKQDVGAGGTSLTAYATHAALISAITAAPSGPWTLVQQGFYASGDGGAATYSWNATSYCPNGTSGSPTTADGLTCILPSSQAATTAGRYILNVPNGLLDVRWLGFHDDGQDNSPLVDTLMTALGPPITFGAGYDVIFAGTRGQAFVTYYFSNEIQLRRSAKYSCTGNMFANGVQLVFAAGVTGVIQEDQAYTSDHGYGQGTVNNCTIISLAYGTGITAASGFATINTVSMYSDMSNKLPVSTWHVGDGVIAFPSAGGSLTESDVFATSPGAYVSGVAGNTLTLASGFTTNSGLPANTPLAIYQLPASLKFTVQTTSGSNQTLVTAGPRLLVPGDVIWSDAFPWGTMVLKVSGTLGNQTVYMDDAFNDAGGQNASKTYTSGAPGQMWVMPTGLKMDVVSMTTNNYIRQFPIGEELICSSAGGLNCTGSSISNNTFLMDGIGFWSAGDNTSGSSTKDLFGGKNYVTDYLSGDELGKVDVNFMSESQENNTAYLNIIGNCANDNYSLFAGGYLANANNVGGCATASGIIPVAAGSPWFFVGLSAFLPAGAPSIGATIQTGVMTGSWDNETQAGASGVECAVLRNEANDTWFGLSDSHCSSSSTWWHKLNSTTNAWDLLIWGSPSAMSLTAGPSYGQSYTGYVDGQPRVNFGVGFLMCDLNGSVGCERLFDAGTAAPTTGEQGNERFNTAAVAGGKALWALTPSFTTTLSGAVTAGTTTSVTVAACPSPSLPAGTQIANTSSPPNQTQMATLSTCSGTTLTFQAAAAQPGASGNNIQFLQARPAALIANDTGGTSWTLGNFMTLTPVAIASLPTCSGATGMVAVVNNGVASPTYRASVSTTGTATQLVFCDGTGWTYH